MARKMIAVHREQPEMDLWQKAETKARQEIGDTAREGEVLAKICAEYLNEEKPFRGVRE